MKLHVVNAAIAEPVLSALPYSLAGSERLVERCGLNPMILESAEDLLPLHAAEELVYRAHTDSGDPCWAFNVLGYSDGPSAGAIANVPLPRRTVALDGVQCFVEAINRFLTGTRFFTELDASTIWIKRTPSTTKWSDSWALIYYNFAVLLAGVRAILGEDIKPNRALVASKSVPSHLPPDLAGIQITTNANYTGLGFDIRILTRCVRSPPIVGSDREVSQDLSNVMAQKAIEVCISKLLCSESTDRFADRTARAFGVSRRSYQRQLASLGLTHREVAANARLTLALDLLTDPAWSITQISFELGYRHPGDFTRFFRSRTGFSPSAHRQVVLLCDT